MSKCIYCFSPGPFNKEHIFPKALGGDDKRYLLVNTVCQACNTRFSRLENSLFREHGLGIVRWIDHIANKRFGELPKINFKSKVKFRVAEEGLLSEPHDPHSVAPQVIVRGQKWDYWIPHDYPTEKFFHILSMAFLRAEVSLVTKIKRDDGSNFHLRTYKADLINKLYYLVADEHVKSYKKGMIWLECSSVERVAINESGDILIQVLQDTDLALFLKSTRKFITGAARNLVPERQNYISTSVEGEFDMVVGLRAIAKIAVNLACYYNGASSVRIKEFQRIKEYIAGKHSKLVRVIPMLTMLDKSIHNAAMLTFGEVPSGHHAFKLSNEYDDQGKCTVFMYCWLYGKMFFAVLLSHSIPVMMPAGLNGSVYFVIDHVSNVVHEYSAEEYSRISKLDDIAERSPFGGVQWEFEP